MESTLISNSDYSADLINNFIFQSENFTFFLDFSPPCHFNICSMWMSIKNAFWYKFVGCENLKKALVP